MGMIQVLDQHIADKIAAGEVIERPLSVVKELLENSIDAGADQIEIEIRDGGVGLIRVRDNGCGMDAGDLQIAFKRHATSKIREFQDLFQLHTFGFRGEALPSVAAVAQVEAISCSKEEAVGHKIKIAGGVVEDFSEIGAVLGTMIEVKHLFYNVPARRKFLKSSSHEAGLIGDLVSKYALGHPTIRFRLVNNGQMQIDTAGLSTVEERISYFYGAGLEKLVVPVSKREVVPGHFLEAWLIREEMTRNNRNQEIFFVNGRLVKSAELSQTLEEGYYTLIAKGRFPLAIVNLELPGSELDVNVHPAKVEIKIHRFEQLRPKLVEQFQDALWEANIAKNAFLNQSLLPPNYATQPPMGKNHSPADGQINQTNQKCIGASEAVPSMENGGKELSSAAISPKEADAQKMPEIQKKDDSPSISPNGFNKEHLVEKKESKTHAAVQEQLFEPLQMEDKIRESIVDYRNLPLQHASGESDILPEHTQPVRVKELDGLTLLGQLNQSFIIAQNAEGLYIIDQHTCHERILYERLMRAENEKEKVAENLLVPVTVHLTPQQDSVLVKHIFTLRELGFFIEHFGERCYLLRSLPFGLQEHGSIEQFFIDLLDDLGNSRQITPAAIKEKLLITASCKGAVKANWKLTEVEMLTLLHDLAQTENAHTCPHGRPIIYKLSMNDLYHIFKRGSYPNG